MKYKPGLDALLTCVSVQGIVYLAGQSFVQMHPFVAWCFASLAGIGAGFNYYAFAVDRGERDATKD